MKIVLTGGGTGGHFYPIIAIAEEINKQIDSEHLVGVETYFISDDPYNKDLLNATRLRYVDIQTGKSRTYFSVKNFLDVFKTAAAAIRALFIMFSIYPDVVFGKGGYASFPSLFAAKILRIPVIIHESDITFGRVNAWAAKFAEKIAISYPETIDTMPKKKAAMALTGIPIRSNMRSIPTQDPFEALQLEKGVPTIFIVGGSQGSEFINEHVMDIVPRLIDRYQIIHQTGEENLVWMKKRAEGALTGNPLASRYHPYAYLDTDSMRLAALAADLVISRAGSTIFEIALWGKPSILIPLSIARGDHQRKNAYSYARTGACTVIEEANLKSELFYSVIDRILSNPDEVARMRAATASFAHTDAAEKIAHALIQIGLRHAK